MPRSIDEGFRDFLAKLRPSDSELSAAQGHRESISSCLQNNFGLKRFVRIGSFGNGTSISGHSDVDYLASLPREALTDDSNYSLQKVRGALDLRFPNTGVAVRCPAVTCPFGTLAAARTEVVPADYMKDERGFKVYDIADGNGGWMKASPDAHNAYVSRVDAKHGGKVKPFIRYVKAWKYFRGVPISSFYLEIRVAKYADAEPAILYDIDMRDFLKKLLDGDLSAMQDPMGVSGYIYPCSSDAKLGEALSKLDSAYGRADKAVSASLKNDISEAFDQWQLLYGEKFPSFYY